MWNGMSILYPKSRILIELQREIPVCLLSKRLVPNGSSRFCLHHPLSLPLLREGRLQAAQQAELCFCHTVIFHAVLTVFLKIHAATAQGSASHPVCLHFSSARMIIVKALPSPCGCSGYRSSLLPSEKSPCTRCSPGQ